MKQVTLYTKNNCPLCEEAKQLLFIIKDEVPFELKEIDIYQDDHLLEKYQLMIPVVEINGHEVDYGQVDMEKILTKLK